MQKNAAAPRSARTSTGLAGLSRRRVRMPTVEPRVTAIALSPPPRVERLEGRVDRLRDESVVGIAQRALLHDEVHLLARARQPLQAQIQSERAAHVVVLSEQDPC